MKTIYYAGIILIIAIVAVNAYFYMTYGGQRIDITFGPGNRPPPTETTTTSESVPPRFIELRCTENSDCSWESTNCCPESAGAKWECINGKTFEPGCPKNVLCPQYVSTRPTSACVCEQNSCAAK